MDELRRLSGGKPVGFKLCLGRRIDFLAICKAMVETGIEPDFVTVDGGEGGTGASPVEFSDHMGMPMLEALVLVHNVLTGIGVRDGQEGRCRQAGCEEGRLPQDGRKEGDGEEDRHQQGGRREGRREEDNRRKCDRAQGDGQQGGEEEGRAHEVDPLSGCRQVSGGGGAGAGASRHLPSPSAREKIRTLSLTSGHRGRVPPVRGVRSGRRAPPAIGASR